MTASSFHCLDEQMGKVCENIAQIFVELKVLEFLDFKKKIQELTSKGKNITILPRQC